MDIGDLLSAMGLTRNVAACMAPSFTPVGQLPPAGEAGAAAAASTPLYGETAAPAGAAPAAAPLSLGLDPLDPGSMPGNSKAAPATRKNPGAFDKADADAKRVLTPDCFDGCRFEISKPLNPKFVLTHVVWMGTSMIPAGNMYQFGTNVSQDSETFGNTLLIGRLDPSGTLDAQWHQTFNKMWKTQASWLITADGSRDMLSGDVTCTGSTFTANAKLAQAYSGLSYFQSVTPSVALGGEVFRHFAQKKTHVFARARYADKKCTATTTYSTMGVLSANYFRKVDHRCGLAAEIELNTANLDSHLTLGYEFVLRQAKLCGQLASTGTVQATLEEMITPGFSVSFSAMLNHKANQQKFGMGVRIG